MIQLLVESWRLWNSHQYRLTLSLAHLFGLKSKTFKSSYWSMRPQTGLSKLAKGIFGFGREARNVLEGPRMAGQTPSDRIATTAPSNISQRSTVLLCTAAANLAFPRIPPLPPPPPRICAHNLRTDQLRRAEHSRRTVAVIPLTRTEVQCSLSAAAKAPLPQRHQPRAQLSAGAIAPSSDDPVGRVTCPGWRP